MTPPLKFKLGWRNRLRVTVRELACRRPGHRWTAWAPVLSVGPVDEEPDARIYLVLGFVRQCEQCFTTQNEPMIAGADLDAIVDEARAEDQEEWDDINARMRHLKMLEDAERAVSEWIDANAEVDGQG